MSEDCLREEVEAHESAMTLRPTRVALVTVASSVAGMPLHRQMPEWRVISRL